MAVRIRLQRKGAKHMAFFRIVAADARSPRDGRFIEQLGYYDPLRDPPEIKIDTEKVIEWFSKGAQPSETVRSLLKRVGVMQTWHEHRKGKPLDELRHIEDDARKRIEAKAAMDKRKKVEPRKDEAEAAKEVREETVAAESAPAEAEASGAEEVAVEPKAEEPAPEAQEETAAGDSGAEEPREEAPAEEAPAEEPPAEEASEESAATESEKEEAK